jgi:hypothetical protein
MIMIIGVRLQRIQNKGNIVLIGSPRRRSNFLD